MIPVIDIFAGPGGLGEGFSVLKDEYGEKIFQLKLSIEKDKYSCESLLLRSFYHEFAYQDVPLEYYEFLRGKISMEQLFTNYPREAKSAKNKIWQAELGRESTLNVDTRISNILNKTKNWILIGGPPCQAYSVIGRSRNGGLDPKDPRVYLYREYYRILAVHSPAIFIMENVRGLLSAKVEDQHIFKQILNDLANPVCAYNTLNHDKPLKKDLPCLPCYETYSFITNSPKKKGNYSKYIIKAEDYGVPQTRHRVIVLGIRQDIDLTPGLINLGEHVPVKKILSGLPKIRSTLSKVTDSQKEWYKQIRKIPGNNTIKDKALHKEIRSCINTMKKLIINGGDEFIKDQPSIEYKPDWYLDKRLHGVCNHSARGHITGDLSRYLFCSCFAKIYKKSPKLSDLPKELLPNHRNVRSLLKYSTFSDRFRVQLSDEPAKTITSHISKDGHYYIHPDPIQCRSLTVREAARIQTFPDNYYFCGPRTSQYIQVGNAVPPLLALQLAKVVADVIFRMRREERPTSFFREGVA